MIVFTLSVILGLRNLGVFVIGMGQTVFQTDSNFAALGAGGQNNRLLMIGMGQTAGGGGIIFLSDKQGGRGCRILPTYHRKDRQPRPLFLSFETVEILRGP